MNRSTDKVRVVCLEISREKLDGGGQRLKAFVEALEAGGLQVEMVGFGPHGGDAERIASSAPLHQLKRRLLPVPLRRRVESELALPDNGATVSLVPSANRSVLQSSPSWLDFPDLWSNIARNHAATVDPVSASFNRAQARLWSSREKSESASANVVTVASWSDQLQMGNNAVWLPHPVMESADSLPRRLSQLSPSDGVIYGLLGNFDYPPNRDAYNRLVRDWLPTLMPTARGIVVAGFGSENLPRVAGVDIIGPVDHVARFYENIDVALAPVERGGGMKVKVVEAMMHGAPVIATEHAKDGLPTALQEECISYGSLSSNDVEIASGFRDPRTNPLVAATLNKFTFGSFRGTITSLWSERMRSED